MTTSIIPHLDDYRVVTQQSQEKRAYCTLQWRQGQLLVMTPGQLKQPYLSSLEQKQSLVDCLKHSPASLVRIDPKLGAAKVEMWADACVEAGKPIYLHLPKAKKTSRYSSPVWEISKRLIDWVLALVLLVISSPVILVLMGLIAIYSPGTLWEREWCIGERGRLFQILKFRTRCVGHLTEEKNPTVTVLGKWMRKYGLENLPLLLNVLRGDMALVGTRCWNLADGTSLKAEQQHQLNKLPGVFGTLVMETEENILHLDGQTL
ncbi:heterocyst development glycosyltransferase HepC [Calothrix sp. 336/3]|uniref:heterocyst development glycosyltransferase HepC n=1 Tax=Calothrix sp. 336/3 TaxID=1337936 RepID=UPI0004E2A365|nr:heterocyst development glycosyltransferase HepC [Calothrix sp. 336/3]AKG23269.1 hypothetical protein IJ00_20070 [Calothrix sp. 336/3]